MNNFYKEMGEINPCGKELEVVFDYKIDASKIIGMIKVGEDGTLDSILILNPSYIARAKSRIPKRLVYGNYFKTLNSNKREIIDGEFKYETDGKSVTTELEFSDMELFPQSANNVVSIRFGVTNFDPI